MGTEGHTGLDAGRKTILPVLQHTVGAELDGLAGKLPIARLHVGGVAADFLRLLGAIALVQVLQHVQRQIGTDGDATAVLGRRGKPLAELLTCQLGQGVRIRQIRRLDGGNRHLRISVCPRTISPTIDAALPAMLGRPVGPIRRDLPVGISERPAQSNEPLAAGCAWRNS